MGRALPGSSLWHRRTKVLMLADWLRALATLRKEAVLRHGCPFAMFMLTPIRWRRKCAKLADHPVSGQRCSICVCGHRTATMYISLLVQHVSAYKKPSTGTRNIHYMCINHTLHVGGSHLWHRRTKVLMLADWLRALATLRKEAVLRHGCPTDQSTCGHSIDIPRFPYHGVCAWKQCYTHGSHQSAH